jgi:hypothetical protein
MEKKNIDSDRATVDTMQEIDKRRRKTREGISLKEKHVRFAATWCRG